MASDPCWISATIERAEYPDDAQQPGAGDAGQFRGRWPLNGTARVGGPDSGRNNGRLNPSADPAGPLALG